MTSPHLMRDGPVEFHCDHVGRGAPPTGLPPIGDELFRKLRYRFGTVNATWAWIWSPHHQDFAPQNILAPQRQLVESGSFAWLIVSRGFASHRGSADADVIVFDDKEGARVFRPDQRWEAFLALLQAGVLASASAEELAVAFEALVAPVVTHAELLQPSTSANERWRAPWRNDDECVLFVLDGDLSLVEVHIDLAHRQLSRERVP